MPQLYYWGIVLPVASGSQQPSLFCWLQKLAGYVFASAHNCRPCSFLYVRFLWRSSCLSCLFHSRARWLLGWNFAYANISLCLLWHSVSNHGWWRCCVVLVRAAGQPCIATAAYKCNHATTARPCQHCLCHSSVLCIGHSVAAGVDNTVCTC